MPDPNQTMEDLARECAVTLGVDDDTNQFERFFTGPLADLTVGRQMVSTRANQAHSRGMSLLVLCSVLTRSSPVLRAGRPPSPLALAGRDETLRGQSNRGTVRQSGSLMGPC